MRHFIHACGALLLVGAAMSSPVLADAGADPSRLTVSQLFDAWGDLATATDAAATAAQRRGDAALAQQQFLLGAMARQLAGEFRSAEQYSLAVRIADLAAPVPALVGAAASALARAPGVDDSSVAKALDQARDKTADLLADVMGKKPYPVLYGMLVRDLAEDPAAQPADLMIYGFDVGGEAAVKKPVVTIGKFELPDSAVRVDKGVVLVMLPDEVKQAIGFAPSPCAGRNTFGVRVRAFYATTHGIWPLTWNDEQSTVADFNALPTPTVYTARIAYSLDAMKTSMAKESFEQKSSFVAADCDKIASTSLKIDLPPGAQDISCQAQWVDTSSAKSAEANCAVGSSGATAQGALSGLPKVCSFGELCSCISSAHGWLEAKGTYRRDAQRIDPVDRSLPDEPSFGPDMSASVALPLAAGETLRGISVAISRRACPKALDSLDIITPAGQAPNVPAASQSGAFRALYAAGRLLVGGFDADAFNAAAGR